MSSIFYTTTEAIRAVLGVTDVEVEETQILNLGIDTQLELETDVVYSDHATVKAAVDANTATTDQQRVWKILQLFCQYQAAVFMLPGIQLLVAQKITDGDFEMQRFMKDSLQETEAKITELRDKYRGLLNPTAYGSGALVHNPMMLATPTYNPVTGEG